MRSNTIRMALASLAFLFALQWSRPARADVTITGTVGEIGIVQFNSLTFRFKLADANQTKACVNPFVPGYAWFQAGGGIDGLPTGHEPRISR